MLTAKPQKDMVDLAVQLIEKKSGSFDATKFEDHYGTALNVEIEGCRLDGDDHHGARTRHRLG